jgi:hypothetical protein
VWVVFALLDSDPDQILAWLFMELLLGEQFSDQVYLITNTNISMDVANVTLYDSPKIYDEATQLLSAEKF